MEVFPGIEESEARVFRAEAHVELAMALRSAQPRFLAIWREEIARALPHADGFMREQFDDGLPKILARIADALESTSLLPAEQIAAQSPEHGETRFHQHFDLNELLIEYGLLRRTIIVEVSRELGRPMLPEESAALNIGFDVAQRHATVAFSRFQAEQLGTEANLMAKYLSFLSHDLRGGLNGSILMIEVLRRDLAGEEKFAESISDLDMMRRSMLDTVATMDRFLHAERLRRGKMPVRIRTVDLSSLLNQLVRSAGYQIADRGTQASVVVDLAGPVETDGDVLTIILQNLLSNAIKYCGGKPIRIEARPVLPPDQVESIVRISVIDEGPGIGEQQLKTLFRPFERGETYGQKGVGLGLTIVRQAADLLGATIHVDSRVGVGTAINLDLPAVRAGSDEKHIR